MTAVVVLTAAVAMIFAFFGTETRLVVLDKESGKTYAEYDISDGDEFSVSFVHSVNLTEVTDFYYTDGNEIVCDKCTYSSFGAGMPSEWSDDWQISYEDNKMSISGLNIRQKEFTYIVGTVYDHVLHINGTDIVLNELCGKNAEITLRVKRSFFG